MHKSIIIDDVCRVEGHGGITVNIKDGKVAEVYRFDYDELENAQVAMSSAHQIGALDAVRLLSQTCPALADCEIIVIGIEPKSIGMGTDLSKPISQSIASAVRLVLGELTSS